MKKYMLYLLLLISFTLNLTCAGEREEVDRLNSNTAKNQSKVTNENHATDETSISFNTSEVLNIFVNADLKWRSPPKEVSQGYTYSDDADLVVFYESGGFAIVSGTLNKYSDATTYSFCQGCGYSIRQGTWKRDNNKIVVVSNYVHQNVPIRGESSPGLEITELLSLTGELNSDKSTIIVPKIDDETPQNERPFHLPTGKYYPLRNLKNAEFLLKIVGLEAKN